MGVFPEALLATPGFVSFKAIGLVNSIFAVVLVWPRCGLSASGRANEAPQYRRQVVNSR